MNEELNVKELFANFVKFNIRNKKRILMFLLLGFMSVVVYQKFKIPYYETKAICSSGISEYERQEQVDDLSQRTAIDLINHLQINVENKDYGQLAVLLNIDTIVAEKIKKIEAIQLYQQDKNEKFYALNKFEILLILYDNKVTDEIKHGLIDYFGNNKYVLDYYTAYKHTCDNLINDINEEITVLNQIRKETLNSSITVGSSNTVTGKSRKLSNEIIALSYLREEIMINMQLLKPLSFVQEFAQVNQKEDEIFSWGLLSLFISYIIANIVSIVLEVR
ncbi:MAG: hypothetical protein CMD16_02730 [Flavobacteriales bacterium]|nr:hypothetical protein [Flavobacteriales bacterium]|tara:strand:+ start:54018 stop:54848 length:831 start_codon:yes stop_codon:yes gene_type:complete